MSRVEQVFVVRRRDFFAGNWPQGFTRWTSDKATAQLDAMRAEGFFVDRPEAEEDPSLKQLIPYCVLTHGSDIFLFQRRKQGTEARLHGNLSIGLGGHIGPEDDAADDLVFAGLHRELHEELLLPDFGPDAVRCEGLCNDDSNAVGSVHAGLVFRLELAHQEDSAAVEIRERHKLSGGFAPLVEFRDLWDDPCRFETWSRIVLEALFNLPSQGEVKSSTQSDQGQCQRGTAP